MEQIPLKLQQLSTNYAASHPRRPCLHIHSTEHLDLTLAHFFP